MSIRIAFAVAAVVLLPALGRTADQPDLTERYRHTANQLIDAALKDDSGYRKLTYLCDRIGNRLSGSEALSEAIRWAAEQMTLDGLTNVATPPVKVPHWVRGQEHAEVLAPVNRPLHMLGLGMSVGTPPDGLTAVAVVVSNFEELAKLGNGVKGKIVVFNTPFQGYGETVAYRTDGPSRAAALGAVAVLVRSVTPLALQQPHTGTLVYAADAPQIPAAAISAEDALLLQRLQESGETPKVRLTMQAHMEPDANSANVIGEIEGSGLPEQIVVMGGHIDSWDVGAGAQDDGSGIMAVLDAAALIQKLGLKPKRTIRVVFWVDEENGGRGGEAYRQWIGDAVKNHVAAIEMDEGAERPVGFGYGPFAIAPLNTPQEQASMRLCWQIARLLAPIDADRVNAGGGGADIEPLAAEGVPTLSPTTTMAHYFDWHHTEADTLDKVNPEDFRKNVALLAVLSYVLADMPGKLSGSTQ